MVRASPPDRTPHRNSSRKKSRSVASLVSWKLFSPKNVSGERLGWFPMVYGPTSHDPQSRTVSLTGVTCPCTHLLPVPHESQRLAQMHQMHTSTLLETQSRAGHDCSTRCGLAGRRSSNEIFRYTWCAVGRAIHHGSLSRVTCWSPRMILPRRLAWLR